jgi:hypothetical protein
MSLIFPLKSSRNVRYPLNSFNCFGPNDKNVSTDISLTTVMLETLIVELSHRH